MNQLNSASRSLLTILMVGCFMVVQLVMSSSVFAGQPARNGYSAITDSGATLLPNGTQQTIGTTAVTLTSGGLAVTTYTVTILGTSTVAAGEVTGVYVTDGTSTWSSTGSFGPGSVVACTGANAVPGATLTIRLTLAAASAGKTVGIELTSENGGNFQGLPAAGTLHNIQAPLTAPVLTTPTATTIAATTATLGANVTSDGGATVTARGTVWGTAAAPTGNQLATTGTTGVFTQARTGLTAQTRIFYRGYATNSVGTAYSPDGSFYTEPATQASGVSFSAVTSTGMTVNWTRGSGGAGGGVIVVMKAATAVDAIPADGTYTGYTANAAFGGGTAITANNFVVFKGTGTSVAVTGLNPTTTYHVAVFEFAGQIDTVGADQGTNYKLTPATGSQATPAAPTDTLSVTANTAVASSAAPLATNVQMQYLQVDSNNGDNGNVVINAITVDDLGTVGATDITNLRVHIDNDNNFGNGVLDTVTEAGFTGTSTVVSLVAMTAATRTVTNGTSKYIWITYDLAASADTKTVQSSVTSIAVDAPDNGATGTWSSNNITVASGPVSTITDCGGCHGNPPVDGARSGATGRFVGSHDKHNYACNFCHSATLPVAFSHRDGTIDFRSGTIGNASGTDNGVYNGGGAAVTQTNTPVTTTDTCSNVDCHYNNVTPRWGVETTQCNSCHASPPATNAHAAHYTAKGWTTPDTTGATCTTCHPDNASLGHDGLVTVLAGLNPAGSGATTTCTTGNTGCHNSYITPQWSATATCTSCHLAGGANAGDPTSGLHATTNLTDHDGTLTGGTGLACEKCHTASPSNLHFNGTVNNAATATFAWNTSNIPAGYDRPNDFCAATCHTDGGTWNREWSGVVDVAWTYADNAATAGVCGNCHGSFFTGWNIIGSTSHDNPDIDNDPDTLATSKASHSECSACHAWGHTNYSTGLMHENNTLEMNSTLGYAAGACSVNCHSPFTLTMDPNSGWTDATVAGDGVTCASCHTGGVNTVSASGAHAAHGATTASVTGDPASVALCIECHGNDGTGATHNNGTLNFTTNLTYSAARGVLSGTCSGTAGCHVAAPTNIQWNQTQAGVNDCSVCHVNTADVDDINGTNNAASMIDSVDYSGTGHGKAGVAIGCMDCHSTAVAHNFSNPIAGTNPFRLAGYGANINTFCSNEAAGCHTVSTGMLNHSEANAGAKYTWTWTPNCTDCHDPHGDGSTFNNIKMVQQNPTDGASGAHGVGGTTEATAVDFTTQGGIAAGSYAATDGKGICQVCHTQASATTGAFLDGDTTPINASSSHPTSGLAPCTSCHTHETGFKASGCNGCHGGDYNADGWTSNNFWPAAGASYPKRGGEHVVHITRLMAKLGYSAATITDQQQQTMCAFCHTYTTTPGEGGHDDNVAPADVGDFNPLWSALTANYPSTTDGDGTYTPGNGTNGTCATVDCHNNNTTSPSYDWYDGATATCTMCHVAGGTGTVDPLSGIHKPGTLISSMPHDDNFASGATCTTCHSTMAAAGSGDHANGANNGNAVASLGLTAGMYTQTSTAGNGAGTCSGGSVAAGACHGIDPIDAGSWARRWDDTISYANNGTTECAGCHGGFAADWTFGTDNVVGDFSVSHDRNWDADATPSEVIGNHTGSTQATRCSSCHVYGDAEYVWGTNHRDRRITMNSTMGYSGTAFNCTTHCHSDNAGHNLEAASSANFATRGNTVAGPAMGCTTCHSGSGGGGLNVGSASPHTIVGTRAGYNTFTSCETCHPQHTGGVLVPNETRVGINYTADGRTGFRLGGTATVGTTEAEICWNCHGNLTYQTTAISEWGVNNKQPGTPAAVTAYNWGTLNQASWVGATWTSAQSTLFAYKTNPIQSTHAANFAATTPGMDTVANIRCSYCHDVHDTYGTNGKPYLRGTWWTNPYLEDGAPVSSITYTGVVPFGNVPRAQASQNQLGGFQIDQNNGNPTATGGTGTGGAWTVADSAGLCWLCHNQNRVGTAVTVNTLDWFGTNDWATNGSGQINGHSNAVVGGTGTNRVNIFRSSWRAPSMGLNTDGTTPDMGYANHGGAVGYGYRATDARGFTGHQPPTNAGNARPYGGSLYNWGATVDDATTDVLYHKFSCSKCHNPHASRLPRLMVTNCLDTRHNTWDNVRAGITALTVSSTNNGGFTLNGTSAPDSWGRTWSNVQSAQNCHRLGDAAQTGYGKGWNNVTPW